MAKSCGDETAIDLILTHFKNDFIQSEILHRTDGAGKAQSHATCTIRVSMARCWSVANART